MLKRIGLALGDPGMSLSDPNHLLRHVFLGRLVRGATETDGEFNPVASATDTATDPSTRVAEIKIPGLPVASDRWPDAHRWSA